TCALCLPSPSLPPAVPLRAPCPRRRLAPKQEGLDDGPDFLSEEDRGLRAINVDLQTDAALQVDISDALSERDKVKFTVHTKSSLPNFKQNEFSVVRQHEEFIWLHDSFVENEDYAGYIVFQEQRSQNRHRMRLHIENGAALHMLIANRNICHLGIKVRYLFCV
uniref:Sorting nexin 6 n=1 Tax=Cyanistes caeruleus TaxID=156563 RepID=A0A8C0VB53_CYACU